MLTVKKVQIADLTFDESNPRKHNDKNLKAIRTSLSRFGQVLPIVVRDGVVVGGNGTLKAMLDLDWEECEVVELSSDLSEADLRALKVALNRTSELAGWDYEVLTPIFQEMKAGGLDLSEYGWDDFEIDPLLKSDWAAPGATDETFTPPERQQTGAEPDWKAGKSSTGEKDVVARAFDVARDALGKKASDRECIEYICRQFMGEL